MCPLGRNANPTTQLAQQPSTLMTNCRPNDGRTKKYRKKVDLHFMHDSHTWRQRTGVKTRSHPPTLLLKVTLVIGLVCTLKVWNNCGPCPPVSGCWTMTRTLPLSVPYAISSQLLVPVKPGIKQSYMISSILYVLLSSTLTYVSDFYFHFQKLITWRKLTSIWSFNFCEILYAMLKIMTRISHTNF